MKWIPKTWQWRIRNLFCSNNTSFRSFSVAHYELSYKVKTLQVGLILDWRSQSFWAGNIEIQTGGSLLFFAFENLTFPSCNTPKWVLFFRGLG